MYCCRNIQPCHLDVMVYIAPQRILSITLVRHCRFNLHSSKLGFWAGRVGSRRFSALEEPTPKCVKSGHTGAEVLLKQFENTSNVSKNLRGGRGHMHLLALSSLLALARAPGRVISEAIVLDLNPGLTAEA